MTEIQEQALAIQETILEAQRELIDGDTELSPEEEKAMGALLIDLSSIVISAIALAQNSADCAIELAQNVLYSAQELLDSIFKEDDSDS